MTKPTQFPASALRSSPRASAFARALVVALAMVAMPSAHAQTYHILHSFTGAGDGGYPQAGVTIDRAGNLYGTTASGGPYQYNGTVYELKPHNGNWTLDTLYNFGSGGRDDGAVPYAGVVFGPDGSLYGTTSGGGSSGDGTVFKLSPPARECQNVSCSWTETILHSFMGGGDGATPYYGSLTFDPAGNIYGATSAGGANNLGPCHHGGCGTVFELSPSNGGWNETIIHAFGGADGDFPLSGVVLDQAGNVYGTTSLGGQNLCDNTPCGTVYELSYSAGSGWAESFLFSFSLAEGDTPDGGLTFDSSGNLYGTTSNDEATVFKLTPSGGSWTYSLAYNLGGTDDQYGPRDTLVMDAAGNLYGTTVEQYAVGTVFKLTPSGDGTWTYTVLHAFEGSDGEFPIGGVAIDPNGNLYGTTSAGGLYGNGVVWEITP